MAIRKSVEEEFVVAGDMAGWIAKCKKALELGGFKSIKFNQLLSEFFKQAHAGLADSYSQGCVR